MYESWRHYKYSTPLGNMIIHEDGRGISRVDWEDNCKKTRGICEETSLLKKAYRELSEYFAGLRRDFDLPLSLHGTAFQQKVWKALRTIPYGEVRTYKQIAALLGNERASRAVGMANNRNPVPILIPCHRVVGSNGKLVGYAGGLELKKTLLKIEGTIIN